MTARPRTRHGYAMVLVVLSLVLFLGLWAQTARQIASVIRIEEARARRIRQDTALLPAGLALAQALTTLEQGFPPSSPYSCGIGTPDGSSFAATFRRDPESPDVWVVSIEPTSDSSLPPLDASQFAAAPPPSP